MLPLVFVKYYDKASTILGADQISQGLRERGHDSYSIYSDRIGEFRYDLLSEVIVDEYAIDPEECRPWILEE